MTDQLLRFYFEYILKVAALIPPPNCYKLLSLTGSWFRNWQAYSAATAYPGVLLTAVQNLQRYCNIPQKKAQKIIVDFLRFESRYVLENNWIKSRKMSYITASFNLQAQTSLLEKVSKHRQMIICTLHSANLFTMGSLLYLKGIDTHFMVAVIPDVMPDGTNPLHENGIRMIMQWKNWQPLIPADISSARKVIEQGHSLFLAPDTPGYKDRGAIIALFDQPIWVPVGAAKLAQEFRLPLIVAIPWAPSITSLYEVDVNEIDTSGTLQEVMQRIFSTAEKTILKNPACWMGWLCLNQMQAK
ncbi:MAG: hypothetical protein ABWK15_03540 [Dissulfuribacterales bacterium]